MSWTGRKRAATQPRKACGRLKPRKPPPPPNQPHRQGFGSNPLAETAHGRYHLAGVINSPQYVAGSLFLRARLRYHAAIGPPHDLRSPVERHQLEFEPDDAQDIAAYEAARKALGKLVTDVEWVLCQDAMLADPTAYKTGLDVLRRMFRV